MGCIGFWRFLVRVPGAWCGMRQVPTLPATSAGFIFYDSLAHNASYLPGPPCCRFLPPSLSLLSRVQHKRVTCHGVCASGFFTPFRHCSLAHRRLIVINHSYKGFFSLFFSFVSLWVSYVFLLRFDIACVVVWAFGNQISIFFSCFLFFIPFLLS